MLADVKTAGIDQLGRHKTKVKRFPLIVILHDHT